jgi:hypothetical protein
VRHVTLFAPKITVALFGRTVLVDVTKGVYQKRLEVPLSRNGRCRRLLAKLFPARRSQIMNRLPIDAPLPWVPNEL